MVLDASPEVQGDATARDAACIELLVFSGSRWLAVGNADDGSLLARRRRPVRHSGLLRHRARSMVRRVRLRLLLDVRLIELGLL